MLMNSGDGEAKLHYEASTFKVLRGGKFVRCAISGDPIPLEALCYWSAEYQEAYATAEIATKRLMGEQ